MDSIKFHEIVEHRLEACRLALIGKAAEYATDDDRLHNFKVAGISRGRSPEYALDGMMLKHIVSMWDIVDRMEDDRSYVPSEELVAEKLGDIINYILLLEAAIEDRRVLSNE